MRHKKELECFSIIYFLFITQVGDFYSMIVYIYCNFNGISCSELLSFTHNNIYPYMAFKQVVLP